MISRSFFGSTPNGTQVDLFRITNATNAEVSIINYGAIIQSLKVPDRNGVLGNVVLGFDNLENYLTDTNYLGAIAGRYAGRIAKGQFELDGKKYQVTRNEHGNHLHGGVNGFNKVVWDAEIISNNAVRLSYFSKDGEEGYPGNLHVYVIYTLNDENELCVDVHATSDQNTIVNLVQHSYFNLSGTHRTILEHVLRINAAAYLPVDEELIPLGIVASVENTPFDFNKPKSIGSQIEFQDEQLRYAKGYDHCWVLDHPKGGMKIVAELYEETSGRRLCVSTNLPALLMYSGNYLSGIFVTYGGVCMETQYFPDAPNHSGFPLLITTPEKPYASSTIFKFML